MSTIEKIIEILWLIGKEWKAKIVWENLQQKELKIYLVKNNRMYIFFILNEKDVCKHIIHTKNYTA